MYVIYVIYKLITFSVWVIFIYVCMLIYVFMFHESFICVCIYVCICKCYVSHYLLIYVCMYVCMLYMLYNYAFFSFMY